MAPHEMTQADFIAQATVEALTNHGRKWIVKLGDYHAFADTATATEAAADVHHGAVNNAIYFNEPDAPDFGAKPSMPTSEVLAAYPDLADWAAKVNATNEDKK